MSHRMLAVRLASWLIALYAGTAGASIYTVGSDAACSHTDIDAALESARTNPGFDTVRIARSQDYFDVDVSTDTSDDLDILGGYSSCAATQTDGTRTTVRGDTSGGGTGDQEPVFRINVNGGATVRMKGLNITKGDEDGDGKGGGVHLSGAGTFQIDDSAVYGNTAGNGGGIGVDGANGFNLVIGADVTISGNNARYNGGGVYIGDYCHLTMIASGSVIALNKALGTDNGNGVIGGYGGGVAVIGAADADIGSGGQGNLGAIYGNEARYGGGVYLKNTQHYGANPATFNLYTTEPLHPGAIRSNFAHNAGGGIYAEPQKDYLDPVDKAYVRIFDANVEDNSAPQARRSI
jgi:hypothetical protein